METIAEDQETEYELGEFQFQAWLIGKVQNFRFECGVLDFTTLLTGYYLSIKRSV